MKKSDLKSGMIVEFRNKKFGIVIDTNIEQVIKAGNVYVRVELFKDDLCVKNECSDWDIMTVRKITGICQIVPDNMKLSSIIWKREEFPTDYHAFASGKVRGEYVDVCSTLRMLLILRDIYRDGWEPDYSDGLQKNIIVNGYASIHVIPAYNIKGIFSFQSQEVAEKFLKNFRTQLESIKDLL